MSKLFRAHHFRRAPRGNLINQLMDVQPPKWSHPRRTIRPPATVGPSPKFHKQRDTLTGQPKTTFDSLSGSNLGNEYPQNHLQATAGELTMSYLHGELVDKKFRAHPVVTDRAIARAGCRQPTEHNRGSTELGSALLQPPQPIWHPHGLPACGTGRDHSGPVWKGCDGTTLVFLGPLDYVGAGGEGVSPPGPVHDDSAGGFAARFTIPARYLSGGRLNVSLAVAAGSDYQFGSYPANECSVPFTVTAPRGTAVSVYRPFTASGATPGLRLTAHFPGGGVGRRTPARPRSLIRLREAAQPARDQGEPIERMN